MFFNRKFPYHGRQFTNPHIVEKYLGDKGENTIILGKNMKISLDSSRTNLNNRFLFFGDESLLIKNMNHWTKNILCYDTNEYYEKYKKTLEESGHTVLKFDPNDPENSISINPFTMIKEQSDISKLSEIILSYTGKGKVNTESSWERSSELPYLNCVLHYIWTEYGTNYQNFSVLSDFLKEANYKEHGEWFYIDTIINKRKLEKGEKDPVVRYYTTFTNAAMHNTESMYYFRKKSEKRLENIPQIEKLLFYTTKFPEKNLVLFFKPGYQFLFYVLYWILKDVILISNEDILIPNVSHNFDLYFEQQQTMICFIRKLNQISKKQISNFDVIVKSGKIDKRMADYLSKNKINSKKKLLSNNNIVSIKNFGTVLLYCW